MDLIIFRGHYQEENMKKEQELSEEELRLLQIGGNVHPWEKWGPYVSERSWGTVREDYSVDGDAWNFFPHDMARSRAYRWGEDGIAGICDRYQVLVLTHAFWNGKDPILKERLYGLNSTEGNHGEDVKEYYFHLDNLPSHSYMNYLYKYPCNEYPYEDLVIQNRSRGLSELEYELLDTGIFQENRYFDIYMEYAKVDKDDIAIKIEIINRSGKDETIHYLPHLFFRNNWAWKSTRGPEPIITKGPSTIDGVVMIADDSHMEPPSRLGFDYHLGKRYFYADSRATMLFTNNETNQEKIFGQKNESPYVKDAFHRYVINGENVINPEEFGTKACFYFKDLKIPALKSEIIYLRFTDTFMEEPLLEIEEIIQKKKSEADAFYEKISPKNATLEEKSIQRQALAGMLWNKQIYLYDVNLWLKGDNPNHPPPKEREYIRNMHWKHLISKRILSMPDKWEYPWVAAWDLAFHCISLSLVDMNFAKEQLWYFLFDQFQHPNGQIPAYEWEFSDLNPPVQAWAALRLFQMDYKKTGIKDVNFLKKCFHKLILNFVWWVNKVDAKGNNVFEGGFLGLDNITIIDRSKKVPGGGTLEQSDGTGWMGLFCLTLMRISLELAKTDPVYEGLGVKFFQHFVYISHALIDAENRQMQNWSEEDGFFYDVLSFPCAMDERKDEQIRVRSLVGIIPLYAIDCIEVEDLEEHKEFATHFKWFIENRQDLCYFCVTPITEENKTKYVLSLMDLPKMKRVLTRVWDPAEFRSEYGCRSLSKHYENNPYELYGNSINYQPGEAECVIKGGNSNWRGPIWFPTSFLLLDALRALYRHVGDSMTVKVGSEQEVNVKEMADYFAHAMINLFKRNKEGKRPIYADEEMFQKDPHWKDHILFFEYFHGDNGRGVGTSHQTGWTGLVANLIDEWIK